MIDPDFNTATWNPPCVFSNITIGRCGLSELFKSKENGKIENHCFDKQPRSTYPSSESQTWVYSEFSQAPWLNRDYSIRRNHAKILGFQKASSSEEHFAADLRPLWIWFNFEDKKLTLKCYHFPVTVVGNNPKVISFLRTWCIVPLSSKSYARIFLP